MPLQGANPTPSFGGFGLRQTVLRAFPSGAMHPNVGHTTAPLPDLTVQVCQVGKTRAGPEVVPQVLDAAFHPAFGLGTVGTAQPAVKPYPQGKVQEPGVPPGSAVLLPTQHHHPWHCRRGSGGVPLPGEQRR